MVEVSSFVLSVQDQSVRDELSAFLRRMAYSRRQVESLSEKDQFCIRWFCGVIVELVEFGIVNCHDYVKQEVGLQRKKYFIFGPYIWPNMAKALSLQNTFIYLDDILRHTIDWSHDVEFEEILERIRY